MYIHIYTYIKARLTCESQGAVALSVLAGALSTLGFTSFCALVRVKGHHVRRFPRRTKSLRFSFACFTLSPRIHL